MSSTQPLAATRPIGLGRWRPPRWRRQRHGAELAWAIAFVVPYAAVLLAFAAYPIGYALWMGASPGLYAELFAEPLYWPAVVNTLLFVGLGVNLKMFLALLLSGFFMRRRWWIKPLLVVFVLPWFLATVQAYISFHWILIGEYGFLDSFLQQVFGIAGPTFFNDRWLALGADIAAYAWKWMPLWTLIFLAGRIAIPAELYDAAEVDGASGARQFVHITFPLLANLYLVCTLLATLWAFGDFATAFFVSVGAPAGMTEVLATLSFRFAFDEARVALGVAAALSALPVVIPVTVLLMRKLQTSELQL